MKSRILSGALALILISGMVTVAVAAPITVDPGLPEYKKTSGVSGNLNSIGSDTLNNLMTFWAEKFRETYPNVNVQIEGKGSSTAPPALIEATSQLGPMSRGMKSKEIDAFEEKFGYKPTPVRVAVDALAVFVHKDNPIKGLNLAQIDAAFSKTQKRGKKNAKTWGDLGLTGDWANRPVSLFGRNSASGTYGFFKKIAMKKGDYKNEVKEQPGSASVVLGVSVDRFGMGYSGIGYRTAGVRALPLSESGKDYAKPTVENSLEGDYPLARFLFVYVNKAPGKPMDPLTIEFLKFVLSKEGQKIVVKGGYFPMPASIVKEELSKLQD